MVVAWREVSGQEGLDMLTVLPESRKRGGGMSKHICDTCGGKHATWEHRIFLKLQLAESGVPIETLFVMPDEETGDEVVDSKLEDIRKALGGYHE